MTKHCILCQKIIPIKTKPEHVLLNALGGRLTTKTAICSDCNHETGKGADSDLADSTAFLRNICGLKAGDGDSAPQIRGLEKDGERFDLKPGMQPQMRPRNPMSVEITDDGITVHIEAYSDKEADKLAEGAAKKIAKHLGHSKPEVIEAIKQDIIKDRKSSFRPAPEIYQQLQFGTGRSQQSMAKACLVLWCMDTGNEEINTDRYDAIREFVKTGLKENDPENLVKIDTRPLPDIPIEYGNNANIIWVGSDDKGAVYGYYRLFGAIGWRFLLCSDGAPPSLQVCLISNPFDPVKWKRLRGDNSPINWDWVSAEWNSYPPQYSQVQARIEAMAEYASNLSRDNFVHQLVSDGLSDAGCQEGEYIAPQHISQLAKYFSSAVLASILKKDIPLDK